MYSTLELEAAILSAHQEISRKDNQIIQIKDFLAKIVKDRDEFQAKCHQLSKEKQFLLQQLQLQEHPSSNTTTSNQDDQNIDDDNNAVIGSPIPDVTDKILPKKPYPKNGKFLQAVMEAGPLLQTLLLAGPLPEWRHPPPQLKSIDIPPVAILSPRLQQESSIRSPSCGFTKKRVLVINNGEGLFDSSPHSKTQKVCSPKPF